MKSVAFHKAIKWHSNDNFPKGNIQNLVKSPTTTTITTTTITTTTTTPTITTTITTATTTAATQPIELGCKCVPNNDCTPDLMDFKFGRSCPYGQVRCCSPGPEMMESPITQSPLIRSTTDTPYQHHSVPNPTFVQEDKMDFPPPVVYKGYSQKAHDVVVSIVTPPAPVLESEEKPRSSEAKVNSNPDPWRPRPAPPTVQDWRKVHERGQHIMENSMSIIQRFQGFLEETGQALFKILG